MITTGSQDGFKYSRTEVIDVINENETCSDLPKFPLKVDRAVGVNLLGAPIVCGGEGPLISKGLFKVFTKKMNENIFVFLS